MAPGASRRYSWRQLDAGRKRNGGGMRKGLTWLVFLATLLGAGFGLACHSLLSDPAILAFILKGLGLLTALFLRAIKMLIAPLVLFTLIGGIGRMGDAGDVGRVALKAM